MKNRKRSTVRIISFLTAVIVAISVWGVVTTVKLKDAKKQITQSNERALTELGTALSDININLEKAIYSSGGSLMSDVSEKLWRSSSEAKNSLSEITDGNTEVNDIYKFLSQVGEYTLSINRRIAENGQITKAETENLNKLLKYSGELTNKVNSLIEEQENGLLDFDMVKTTLQDMNSTHVYLGGSLTDANQTLGDYPTLIYDGPFSDHIESKKSALVEGLKAVSENEAKKIAAKFLNINEEKLKLLSKTKGNLSTYSFYNDNYTISVTQKGGIVNYYLSSKYASEIKLNNEQAIRKATEYLNEKGYKNIKESYYSITDGICTINFSYYLDGITYYTDLIKVSVALDSGEITAFDSTGYIMNHKSREIPQNVQYSIIELKKNIKPELQVLSYKKAFIPTPWESEIYVYEYHCKAKNGQEVLIYLDPVTGEEKDILLLLYSDKGVLTK